MLGTWSTAQAGAWCLQCLRRPPLQRAAGGRCLWRRLGGPGPRAGGRRRGAACATPAMRRPTSRRNKADLPRQPCRLRRPKLAPRPRPSGPSPPPAPAPPTWRSAAEPRRSPRTTRMPTMRGVRRRASASAAGGSPPSPHERPPAATGRLPPARPLALTCREARGRTPAAPGSGSRARGSPDPQANPGSSNSCRPPQACDPPRCTSKGPCPDVPKHRPLLADRRCD
mmetsp:Transcript_7387/g.27025  ORF Transcript_7387/g.27025 Transcript_7387/m.27025 type:complete len:226 (-) Transcript_7387:567-1244(-)